MSACVVQGYEAEVEQEQIARNLVYLDQPEIVLGETICNITPHFLAVLSAIKTPFYCGGPFDHKHVAQFLWSLHRDYSPNDKRTPRGILARVLGIPLEQCRNEIAAFMDLTFMDMPRGGKEEKPIASGIAWLIYRFRHKPWEMCEEETKHTPLRKLYQELRCFERENEQVVANKSDQKKATWLQALNEALRTGAITQAQLDEWNVKCRELREGDIDRVQFDQWRATAFERN